LRDMIRNTMTVEALSALKNAILPDEKQSFVFFCLLPIVFLYLKNCKRKVRTQ